MENSNPEKDNIKNLFAYIPLVNVVIFFAENNKSDKLLKHLKYWIFLLIAYFFWTLIIGWMFKWLLTLAYFIYSWYLWYKVYNWEDFNIKFLDDILNKI